MSDTPGEYVPSSEATVTPPDSQQQPDLLSTLIAMDCAPKMDSNNLMSALLNMDRENLADSSLLDAAIGFKPKPKLKRKIVDTAHYPQSAIKRIIQSDKQIGRMKREIPSSIGMAMEHFAADFIQACAEEAQKRNCYTVKPCHMASVMQKNPCFAFLEKVLGEYAVPSRKRQQINKPIPEEVKPVEKED